MTDRNEAAIRDFPYRRIKVVLAKLLPDGESPLYQECLDDLKSLWEGQEAKTGDAENTCKRCGGFERIGEMELPRPEDLNICPQCDGSGEERRSGTERRRGLVPFDSGECDYCKYYDDVFCKRHAPVTEPVEAGLMEQHLNVQRPIWPKMGMQIPRWCGDYTFSDRRKPPDRRK